MTRPSRLPRVRATKAVFFDVDFTLIRPGPTFEGEGYRAFCARHRIDVDASRFEWAVARASAVLEEAQDGVYDPALFIRYARNVVEGLGGEGPNVEACAREIYEAWAACQHFILYDDVAPVFQQLRADGLQIGLISNTHRCLSSFQSHFALDDLVSTAVSSSEHGYMKPHPSIFEAALTLTGVSPSESVMVGDSLVHDVDGARRVGMRAVLVSRSGRPSPPGAGVPVIRSLTELPDHL